MAKKIMVVDDEVPMLEFVKTGLRLKNYDVVGTSDAFEAINMAHIEKPDLIILDYKMPGVDGYNIHKGLKASKITKDIPVIFITGYSTPDVLEKIIESKSYGYILKPFDVYDLIKRVEEAFERKLRMMNQQ